MGVAGHTGSRSRSVSGRPSGFDLVSVHAVVGMLPDIALVAAAQGEYSYASRRAPAPGSLYRLGGLAMLVMFTAKYPASSVKRAIEVFSSPETPKRSDAGKEVSVRSRQPQRVYQLSALRRGPA